MSMGRDVFSFAFLKEIGFSELESLIQVLNVGIWDDDVPGLCIGAISSCF